MFQQAALIVPPEAHEGHFNRAVDLECLDSRATIEAAKKFVDGHHMGLWQRHRLVANFGRDR
jgi:hypothetical protein